MTLHEYKMLSEDDQWDAVISKDRFRDIVIEGNSKQSVKLKGAYFFFQHAKKMNNILKRAGIASCVGESPFEHVEHAKTPPQLIFKNTFNTSSGRRELLGAWPRESPFEHLDSGKANSLELVFIPQNFTQVNLVHFAA